MIDKRVGLRLCELTVSLLGVLVCGAALAATITVNSLADPGAPGICTLRDAITAANTMTATNGCAAGSGDDTIKFRVMGTIKLGETLPEVTDSQLTITGFAAPGIAIDGDHRGQLMQVASGATLKLNNLTIANSNFRAGISNEGTLTVINGFFTGNSGGAIDNSGRLAVANSVVFASGDSGIANEKTGTSTVTNSTFSSNHAFDGGGVFNRGTLTVTNSTFSNNGISNPDGRGGAIFNLFGTLTVTNSTFSHNSARFGGAIDNAGTLFVTNSTFSGNAESGPAPGGGAGIANESKASIQSTILAANVGGNCLQFAPITDAGYNISNDASCGFAKTGSAHNGDGVDPHLSSAGLADNGGPTPTIALQEGSPAIDAIPAADCTDQASPPNPITTGQRGLPHPDAGEPAL